MNSCLAQDADRDEARNLFAAEAIERKLSRVAPQYMFLACIGLVGGREAPNMSSIITQALRAVPPQRVRYGGRHVSFRCTIQ
jgi:hypothetical protein